jgi:hypothetical protein
MHAVELIVDSLFAASAAADRCPHLLRDAQGPRCASPACQPGKDRLMVGSGSRQLWFLAGPQRWPNCWWFRDSFEGNAPSPCPTS